jgi:VIT1/CCC1 family predicted Fe2+/Mn2+ transporter
MNRLPNEKRKGYLLRPQAVLTMKGLVERILEKDGITKEMIQAQQDRLNLLQRMMTASSEDVRTEIAKQSEALMDEQFYGLISQLADASISSGDEKSARQLAELQKMLLPLSAVGRTLLEQSLETEAAIKSLQEASQKGLSRESLLDLLVAAPTDTRLYTLVSMARSGMDYIFFQLLSDRIDRAEGDEKKQLTEVRSKVLTATDKIDAEVKKQIEVVHKLLDELLNAPDIGKATSQHLPELTELFVEVLKGELNTANQKKDQARLDKLNQIVAVLQQASQPTEEIAIIEDLLEAPDETSLRQVLEANKEAINDEFLQFFGNILNQAQTQSASQKQDPRMIEKLQSIYRTALRFSMEAKLKG